MAEFSSFSLAAEQDLRKGKIEGGLGEQRQFAGFTNVLERQGQISPPRVSALGWGVSVVLTLTLPLPQGLSRVRDKRATLQLSAQSSVLTSEFRRECHFTRP